VWSIYCKGLSLSISVVNSLKLNTNHYSPIQDGLSSYRLFPNNPSSTCNCDMFSPLFLYDSSFIRY
jgi:hypothetical protein